MKTFKYLVLFFPFLFVSCSWFMDSDSTGSSEEYRDNADFIIDEIKGTVVPTSVNGLPEEIQIFYVACFRDDERPDNTIQNGLFKIHFFENTYNKNSKEASEECPEKKSFLLSSGESCIKVRTDSSGCLKWTEIYPYSPISESAWFKYSRTFEGAGGGSAGDYTINMAVNPWLGTDPEGSALVLQLVDLRYHSIDQKKVIVKLEDKDIPECRSCPPPQSGASCKLLCKEKKRSLSAAISHFQTQSSRPRLWLHEVASEISQEHIPVNNNQKNAELLKRLKVCHNGIQTNCDPPGRFLKVRLQMPLTIKVKDYRGDPDYLPLTRGQYSIKPYLFLKNDQEQYIVLNRDTGFVMDSLFIGTKKNSLISEFYIHIPYEHYGMPAFLGLKVQAEGEHKDLFLPFEGVFPFSGKLKKIMESNNLKLEKRIYEMEKKTNGVADLIDRYNLSGSWDHREDFRKAGWHVILKRLRFSDIDIEKNKCPTPVDRHVRYVGEVCIVDPLTGELVSNTDIKIQRQNILHTKSGVKEGQIVNIEPLSPDTDMSEFKRGKWLDKENNEISAQWYGVDGKPLTREETYNTDTSGCVQWVDTIYHKFYNREQYFDRKMIFSKEEWGFTGERIIAINPWHWGFVFFQDITELKRSPRGRKATKRAERPQIILHDFRSVFPELVYSIDRLLGINIFQNILFLFKVRIDRPDSVASGQGGQSPSARDIRRQYYFLRFIIVKSHTEEGGGQGNAVVNDAVFRDEYRQMQNWNTNTGWRVGRNGSLMGRFWNKNIGQMMNTRMEYITHYDTYVQIRDSTINAYVNFLFELGQFIYIGSNNRLIAQLLPTDPAKYEYYPGTCEVDPTRSDFVPYTGHELISRPFMGTFVSGDVRNWNIFRVLGDPEKVRDIKMDEEKFNSEEEENLSGLSHAQLQQLIDLGKKHSQEHKLFTKLHSKLVINAGVWSSKSRAAIQDVGDILEELYDKIGELLQENYDESTFSRFNQKRIQLAELTEKAKSQLLASIDTSSDENNKDRLFLTELSRVVDFANELLQNTDQNSLSLLKRELNEVLKSFTVLVGEYLGVPLSADKDLIRQSNNKDAIDKHFNTDIVTASNNPNNWSGINMAMFAQDEGLKIITLDDESAVHQFLADLDKVAGIHNHYNEAYRKDQKSTTEAIRPKWLEGRAYPDGNPSGDLESWKKEYAEIKAGLGDDINFSEEAADEKHKQITDYQKRFLQNFAFIEGDDYFAMKEKTERTYIPRGMTSSDLNNIVIKGIHPSTLNNPEVMTFLHSLCGFWFDKFYENYMEQNQLDTIYDKHLDHFNYYKSTLQYFTEEGLTSQYNDLYEAMKKYSLLSEIDQNMLVAGQNPFQVLDNEYEDWKEYLLRQATELWDGLFSSEEQEEQDSFEGQESQSDTVIQSLYKSLKRVGKEARDMNEALAMSPMNHSAAQVFFEMLTNHRHPYFKCMANPLNFLHIEKKVIVGDIGHRYSDIKYEYGRTASINTQVAFDYAYSATWNMSRSFSTSLGTGFTAFNYLGGAEFPRRLKAGPGGMSSYFNPLNRVNPVFAFSGIDLKSSWSTSRSESEQNRRQFSLRFANEALYLHTHESAISIRLKNFRHCLVVRAKNLAFDGYEEGTVWRDGLASNFIHQIPYIKSGLLICSEDIDAENQEDPFYITEKYFYLYQVRPGDSQFFNLFSYRNRPFVLSIRGKTEMEKLGFLMQSFIEADKVEGMEDYDPLGLMTNPYNTVSKPAEGTQKSIEKAKIWDKTGFYPGVYSVTFDNEHYFFRDPEKRDPGMLERLGKWFERNNPFGFIRFDDTEGITQRPHRQ